MRVLHAISSIAKSTGGPARSSQGLVAALEKCGVESWLLVFNENEKPWVDGVVHFKSIKRSGYRQCKKSFEQIVDEIKPNFIHIHGLWVSATHIACVVARKKGIPYIIAPRGMLEPWALNHKKWKKFFAMLFYQRFDLKKAIALHATAEAETKQVRQLGFSQKIVVSPNAITFPEYIPPRTCRGDGKRVVLFLSRIHPVKGLLMLVEAVFQLKKMDLFDEWHVEYAGPDYGHHREVLERIAQLGLLNEFTYLGDLDDVAKWSAYARANLFVLPTHTENFGIVIAEALYAGCPVITTQGTPWQELEVCQCGKWIEIGASPLVEALKNMMALTDEERAKMGRNGKALVEREYTWESAAEKMHSAYVELLNSSHAN